MKSWLKTIHNEQGFALLLALFIVTSVMVIGMSIMTVSMVTSESSGQVSVAQQNFQVADGAAELGKGWFVDKNTPPELDPTFNASAPWDNFTAWSNDINPDNPATGQPYLYPQYRYMIAKHGVDVQDLEGGSLTVGEDYGNTKPTWHNYKITAQSRSGKTAAQGADKYDRTIVMLCRRMYLD